MTLYKVGGEVIVPEDKISAKCLYEHKFQTVNGAHGTLVSLQRHLHEFMALIEAKYFIIMLKGSCTKGACSTGVVGNHLSISNAKAAALHFTFGMFSYATPHCFS